MSDDDTTARRRSDRPGAEFVASKVGVQTAFIFYSLEHLSDELASRHSVLSHAWEQFHQDLSQLAIDGHRMLADHCKRMGEDYSVVFGGDRELEPAARDHDETRSRGR